MKFRSSKLAQLVIAYHERFGRYVPAQALRLLDAGDLAPILQDSLATGAALGDGLGLGLAVQSTRLHHGSSDADEAA